jgi:formate hydrogenlyase subunit 6/NADH:ubiquinone oxidoreductase subunit I
MTKAATVTALIEALEKLESQHIKVHAQRCVRVRNRHASCTRCSDACTSGAIALAGELSIDPDLCVGCGTCATLCPTCALEAVMPNDAQLLKGARAMLASGSDAVSFICSTAAAAASKPLDPSKAIEIVCLSRVEEVLLCSCLALGAKRLELIKGDCEDCPRKQGVATIDIVAATMEALMAAWGIGQEVICTDEAPGALFCESAVGTGDQAADGLSRREFFSAIRGAGARIAVTDLPVIGAALPEEASRGGIEEARRQPAVTHVMLDGTLPHFVPNRRERLLEQLDALGSPSAGSITTRLWGRVSIEEALCSSCRMCATFCPTGAICKFDDANGDFGVEHYMADCVHCCLCVDICPQHAISCTDTVPIRDLVEGSIERHYMKPLQWQPNRGDSIWRKMQQVIPNSNINERC